MKLFVMTDEGANARPVEVQDIMEYMALRIPGHQDHQRVHLEGTAPVPFENIRWLPDHPDRRRPTAPWGSIFWNIWNCLYLEEQRRLVALIREENFTSDEILKYCMRGCRVYYEKICIPQNMGRRFIFHEAMYADQQYTTPSANTPPLP